MSRKQQVQQRGKRKMSGNSSSDLDFEMEVDDNDEGSSWPSPSTSSQGQGQPVPASASADNYVTPVYPTLPNTDFAVWSYKLRRNMQEVLPGLFLGPYGSATRKNLNAMQAAGLTHVVCVRQDLERHWIRPNHPDHFTYHVVEIADSLTENIIPHFKDFIAFVGSALAGGGRVLVHGNGGASRSAALVIAFIMSSYGVTCKDAYMFVQERRFCLNPNENFLAQLREYEPIYRANHTVPRPLPNMESYDIQSNKRALEDDDEDDFAADHKSRALDQSN